MTLRVQSETPGAGFLRHFLLFVLCLLPAHALADDDYDPRSLDWNGTSEIIRTATDAHIDLRPERTLDWDNIQRGQALLVLYPRENLGVADLSAFLDDGGRVAWFDDFGASRSFYEWFQFRRETNVQGIPRTPELPELLVARPRGAHALTEGVDVLLTNIPVALSHPRLTPVYDFAGGNQGFLLVGQIGSGKLVVGGDPSVVINSMMRFPGNRRFARNLLEFLGTGTRGRITMVWGNTRVRGIYRGRSRARTPAREAVNTLNDALTALSNTLSAPTVLRPFAMLLALGAACVMAAITWGRRPSERYGPRGPAGTAAGVAERVALYTTSTTNLLFPVMLARRYFEQSLLRAVGVRPPADVRAVLDRMKSRLTSAQRAEVQSLLVELDELASGADEGHAQRVTTTRFLSLWRRISAILTAIGSEK
jgi:hypothetical protein